jgi:hypothetical protein
LTSSGSYLEIDGVRKEKERLTAVTHTTNPTILSSLGESWILDVHIYLNGVDDQLVSSRSTVTSVPSPKLAAVTVRTPTDPHTRLWFRRLLHTASSSTPSGVLDVQKGSNNHNAATRAAAEPQTTLATIEEVRERGSDSRAIGIAKMVEHAASTIPQVARVGCSTNTGVSA